MEDIAGSFRGGRGRRGFGRRREWWSFARRCAEKRVGNTESTEGRTQSSQGRGEKEREGAIRSGWRGFVCPESGVRRQRAGECRCPGRCRHESRCCPGGWPSSAGRRECGCKDCLRGDDWGRESHILFSTFQGR